MAFTRVDLLSTAQRSLAAAGAHDRDGWIGLFTADGTIEDPVGSRPHRGAAAIGKFYDTFIGPRTISFRPDGDIVVDTTVIRDVELIIAMTPTLTLRVPTFIRHDLRGDERDDETELKVCALSAYWELPAMVAQFARSGLGAVPSGITLGRTMLTEQGLSGCVGFLRGFRRVGSGAKGRFTDLLEAACEGDELGLRRRAGDASITHGDRAPMTTSELLKNLSGGSWAKAVQSGPSVAARVERAGRRWVLIGETGPDRSSFSRLRLFGETVS